MFNRYKTMTVALSGALFFAALPLSANAASANTVFGDTYQPVAPVPADQVQVVYYRTNSSADAAGSAHVYVDKEFHAGLLPNGFSAFCLRPGIHSISAYLNDSPLYQGKQSELYNAELQGGTTYFMRVSANNIPQAVERAEAERELAGSRVQKHALSRASQVEACNYLPVAAAPVYKDYNLSGDVLFAFGKSDFRDITRTGHVAIQKLAVELQRDHAEVRQIQVVGHTDPIGKGSVNYLLGLKRAQTVSQLLVDAGMPSNRLTASSAGSSDPVVEHCSGNRAAQVACNAPNRRVQVRVDVTPVAQ
ncbi:OmpA family protein [Pseudomonas sp. SED1]|uniref:OmpA family protein n=1 Tax=Pseudomonas sp. SED1 TaxID=3056845 RepID=UPI00296E88FE|nr:OmpA family protein [Pseudomonas sp. SED1]MDY0836546.1 OmpA family protein [Pseudomonas sp. SED1]